MTLRAKHRAREPNRLAALTGCSPTKLGIIIGRIHRVLLLRLELTFIFIERSEVRLLTVAFCDSLDGINGSSDTTNWLGRYSDRSSLSQYCTVVGWPHLISGTIALRLIVRWRSMESKHLVRE